MQEELSNISIGDEIIHKILGKVKVIDINDYNIYILLENGEHKILSKNNLNCKNISQIINNS